MGAESGKAEAGDAVQVIAPGAQILVRDAVWRVTRVNPTSSGTRAVEAVGVSEIVRDQDAIFLEEYEPSIQVLDPKDTRPVADPSPGHRAGLLYLEALLRDLPPEGEGISVGHKAALDVIEFQLDPARRVLEQLRPRILIADGVGLGKTMECGILLSELIRRGRARRILVVTVKAMLTQFQKEMWTRFTIPLVRLDSVGIQRIREQLPTNHNPFHHFDRTIISIDTLKQKNAIRIHLEQARWDVIVIDEAHNVAERGKDASQRNDLARLLAGRSDALILLSATPHDGKARSFASLMNMLDPTAIANPDDYTADEIRGLYVRRFKRDVQAQISKHFPERKLVQQSVQASAAEEAVFDALVGLELEHVDKSLHGGMLFKTQLKKALFSSPGACVQTLETRIKNLGERKDAALLAGDIAALEALKAQVAGIQKADFSRYQGLVALLRSKAYGWSPKAKDDRLVIFTERLESMRFLKEHLPTDLGLKEGQLATLDGSMSDVEQQDLVEEFGKESSKVRVLVATDVASEGLNLHYLCHRVIHFDIPWSLMVFQQRNGRIDRYGQEREPLIHFLYGATLNKKIAGDFRVLELLIKRDKEAAKNIGDPSVFFGKVDAESQADKVAEVMESGAAPEEIEQQMSLEDAVSFEKLLAEGKFDLDVAAPPMEPPSLFDSHYAWLAGVVEHLQASGLHARVDSKAETIELELPPDLRRRFDRLPREILPEERWLCLTASSKAMQDAIKACRAEEIAWPPVQYLWPLHPAFSWAADRVRGLFGRHEAPVLGLGSLGKDEIAVVVSGLVPNRQSQPMVHRWYAAIFQGESFQRMETFPEFLARTKLGRTKLPNLGVPRMAEIQACIPEAVERTEALVLENRKLVDESLRKRLTDHLVRLEELRKRKLVQLELQFPAQAGPTGRDLRSREARKIDDLFAQVRRYTQEVLTTEPRPFLQVVALLVGEKWISAGGAA